MIRSLVLFAILLLAGTARAANVVITVKGTVTGEDYLILFGGQKIIPKDSPYILTFTFTDAVGGEVHVRCPNSGSGVTGVGKNSPGTAVLEIEDGQYQLGFDKADSRSVVWRLLPSRCGGGGITMMVSDGRAPLLNVVQITIQPAKASWAPDADWRSPVSLSGFTAPREGNTFTVTRAGSFGLTT